MASRLLVVHDEPSTGKALQGALALEGFDVMLATDDAQALGVVEDETPDAVIVDVAPTDSRGAALCRSLREASPRLAVLMLGAHDTAAERTSGRLAEADDYLAKPFVLVELLTRLRALLRRKGRASAEVLRFADVVLDPATHEVLRGTRPVELTLTEFGLLELFLQHPREVLPRSVIFSRVWGFDFAETSNSLNVYVGHLRRKLEAGGESRLIHTVRGIGYVLR
jgi:two-component system response regulator MprA